MIARILVVEDCSVFRQMVCDTLVRAGYAARQADNLAAARRIMKTSPPEIIILGGRLMQRDEGEFVVELKEKFPGVKAIAVLGGPGSAKLREIADGFGDLSMLPKAFTPSELLQTVELARLSSLNENALEGVGLNRMQ